MHEIQANFFSLLATVLIDVIRNLLVFGLVAIGGLAVWALAIAAVLAVSAWLTPPHGG